MVCGFQTKEYEFEYVERMIETKVLWESHCHTKFEMIAVLEGDISVMLEGRSYRLTENQTIIIPALAYHTITANKNGIYRRVTAQFELETIPYVIREHFLRSDANLTPSLLPQVEELKRICKEAEPLFYAPLAQSLMVQIFYGIMQSKRTLPETDEFLQKAVSYIDGHLHEKILLDDLAKHTSRSTSSFCHLFEERMGISPKQYIVQKKLTLANKLIQEGAPPTLAAIQIGYENYSNFYRIYRKHFGTNPTNDTAKGVQYEKI